MTECGILVNFWLLSGSSQNWNQALREKEHLWATRDTPILRSVVQRIMKGDFLVFYATRPIGGVMGFGVVESERFTGTQPYWPDERKASKVIYPHRFKLSVVDYFSKGLRLDELGFRPSIFRSINSLTLEHFEAIVRSCANKWPEKLGISSSLSDFKEGYQKIERVPPKKPEPQVPSEESGHTRMIDMIGEIGRLKGLVVEKEYPIDSLRLDVAWKKIARGNPHAAFEVQIGGNFFEALTKLKHAWDIWRSVPYLITTEEYAAKARQLVEGSFHEIRNHLRIVDFKVIKELHSLWTKIDEIEHSITLSEI